VDREGIREDSRSVIREIRADPRPVNPDEEIRADPRPARVAL
jgi:hypothetical protein